MTKSEYRAYIGSEAWQVKRAEFLGMYGECAKCGLPRYLAVVAYDQDLHVHHKNYLRVGAEQWDDLQALCRRCHEIHTFGHSQLHEVRRTATCPICKVSHYDRFNPICDLCAGACHVDGPGWKHEIPESLSGPGPLWKTAVCGLVWCVNPDEVIEFVIECKAKFGTSPNWTEEPF
jgi:hypothetical protein